MADHAGRGRKMSDYFEPNPRYGNCLMCGRDCEVIYEDDGIGVTEYGGSNEDDSVMCAVSNCCGVEVG